MNRRSLLILAVPSLLRGVPLITGRWRSVTTTRGGIGAVYEFDSNGKVTYSSAAIVEMDYRQDHTVLTPSGPPPWHPALPVVRETARLGGQSVGIGWHPDGRLQINYGKDVIEDFTRRGKVADAANPILGEWSGSRVMEGRRVPVTLQFREGNRALLVILLNTHVGRYQPGTVADGTWTLVLASLPPRQVTHDPATGNLNITAQGGDPHLFARF